MTLAYDVKQTINLDNGKLTLVDITGDASYPTGGWAITAAAVGLNSIQHAIIGSPPVGGVVASFDDVGVSKLKMWTSSTGAPLILQQADNAEDLSLSVFPCMFFGD